MNLAAALVVDITGPGLVVILLIIIIVLLVLRWRR